MELSWTYPKQTILQPLYSRYLDQCFWGPCSVLCSPWCMFRSPVHQISACWPSLRCDTYLILWILFHALFRFFNITVSVTKIYSDGKTSTLGKRFAMLCITTSILAVVNGVCVANLFSSLFTSKIVDDDDEEGAEVELRCPEGVGRVTVDPTTGRLFCLLNSLLPTYNLSDR